jgi:GNAT superfamily N-acetyltransferase
MQIVRPAGAQDALEMVQEPLRASGAAGEVSFGILTRLVAEPDAWGTEVTILVAVESGRPAALVTMTGPHPALIVAFTELGREAYAGLVAAMLAEGRRPSAVNGARDAAASFADAFGAAGAKVQVRRDVRMFELRQVRPPPQPAGQARTAAVAETGLLERWTLAFFADVCEPETPAAAARTVAHKLAHGDLLVWERDGGVVSMAGVVRRTAWSSSIALVYTPPELRGSGYGSAVVAALSQRELDAGQEWCSLLADVANPTTNHIYTAIGYEPKCDMRHLVLAW